MLWSIKKSNSFGKPLPEHAFIEEQSDSVHNNCNQLYDVLLKGYSSYADEIWATILAIQFKHNWNEHPCDFSHHLKHAYFQVPSPMYEVLKKTSLLRFSFKFLFLPISVIFVPRSWARSGTFLSTQWDFRMHIKLWILNIMNIEEKIFYYNFEISIIFIFIFQFIFYFSFILVNFTSA